MTYTINELPRHSSIVEELNSIKNKIQTLEEYRRKLLKESAFAALILSRAPENARVVWVNTQVSVILAIFIPVQGFTLEAAPQLCEFLEYIIPYYDVFPSSMEDPNLGTRTYMFSGGETEQNLTLHVTAELQEDSEACLRRVIGTRTVTRWRTVEIEEPIYSFKC